MALIPDKVTQFKNAADVVHGIAHGPASGDGSMVETDNGLVRTIAKLILDSQAAINAQAPSLAQLLEAGGAEKIGYQSDVLGAVVRRMAAKAQETISMEDLGADPEGVIDISAALDKAQAHCALVGGIRVVGKIDHIYRLNANYNITNSNFHIDLQFATMVGNGRLIFNGDSGIAGDGSKRLKNCSFRDARIGGPTATQAYTPMFL